MQKSAILIIFGVLLVAGGLWLQKGQEAKAPEGPNSDMLENGKKTPIFTRTINYYDTVYGFFTAPQADGNYPGVVMVHEWWGLNQNIKDMAESLAKEGYRVLAVDLYRGKVATTREEAQQYRNALTEEDAIENMQAAVEFLRREGSERIASLGWCFGGGKSLELALSGEKLNATVIYYGNLVTS